MKVQTFSIKPIEWETKLEAGAIRLETTNAKFEIRENADGSIRVRAYDVLVTVAVDGSSAIMVAAPFDNSWILDVNGKAYSGQEGME